MSPISAATVVPGATAGSSPCTASTTPTSSIPRIRGNVTASPAKPLSVLYSDRLSPNASTLTSAQPGRGSGRGTSRTTSPSGPSGRSATTARICAMAKTLLAHLRHETDARRQSWCLDPLLSTIFQRLFAFAPPLPENRIGDAAPEALPPAPRPDAKVSIGSRQLSSTELQLVPAVGAEAVANTPCARLSEP